MFSNLGEISPDRKNINYTEDLDQVFVLKELYHKKLLDNILNPSTNENINNNRRSSRKTSNIFATENMKEVNTALISKLEKKLNKRKKHALKRWKKKRKKVFDNYGKNTIKYEVRHKFAKGRPRKGGRFIKSSA